MEETITGDCELYDADAWSYGEGWDYVKRSIVERYVDDEFVDANYPEGTDVDDVIERECGELDDYTVWEEVAWYREADYDDAVCRVERGVHDGDTVIFTGTIGRWDGVYRGGGTADSFADALRDIAGRDCEIQTIEIVDGDVHVIAVHHDGRNSFTMRGLTDAGCDALDEWEDDEGPLAGMSECEAHRALFRSDEYTYSIKPEW